MKIKIILRNVFTRAAAIILFFAVCLPVLAYAAGVFKIPFIDTERPVTPPSPELSSFEETMKQLTEGENVNGSSTEAPGSSSLPGDTGTTGETGTDGPDTGATTAAEPTTSGGSTPQGPLSMEYYSSLGYKLSWASWSNRTVLAEIELEEGVIPGEGFTSTAEKKVTNRVPLTYESNGIEFLTYVTKNETRQNVELYMGYIIIAAGKTTATGLFPVPFIPGEEEKTTGEETTSGGRKAAATKSPETTASPETAVAPDETGTTEPEPIIVPGHRDVIEDVEAVAIYSSYGKLIGIYPSELIQPAYTRETDGSALFVYDGKYYYLDEETGDFCESDYIDERDNRGLYFDYNPDYGTSDNNLKIWSTYQEITLHYLIDKAYHYARFGIDWRITRALYEADPEYAEIVGKEVSPGHYYNLPFRMILKQVKKDIAAESKAALTATTEPVTTEAEPVTSELTEEVTTLLPESPDVTTELLTPAGTETPLAVSATESTSNTEATTADTAATEASVPVETAPAEQPSSSIDTTAQETAPATAEASGTTVVPEDITTPETLPSPEDPTLPGESSADSTEETTPEETTEYTLVDVETKWYGYRFAYGKTQPAIDPEVTSQTTSYMSIYLDQTISWATGYKYAKAYNFRGGRAYTVDDNGCVRIINVYGGSPIYVNYNYYPEKYDIGTYVHSYYIEPFYRDVSMIGHYYFDEGYIRVRHVETLSYSVSYYITDEDILVDIWGNKYEIPTGFNMVSYSEGILILERNGLYGCYHVDGYWVAQPMYSSAEPFIEGLCVLGLSDGTKGMIDTSGNIVIPFSYSYISNVSSGVISCYSEADGWRLFAKMRK